MRQSASSPSSLALSSFHIQLESLEKEHEWLLKQIKKKRTELKNFVEQMRSIATEIFNRGTPSFKRLSEIDQEIHALFDEIFRTKKLGQHNKRTIEAIYLNLQLSGVITPNLDDDDKDAELDELFENSDAEKNPSESQQSQENQPRIEFPFHSKADVTKKVRQTFLRLAEIFHPDKVTDSETQMRHTEIMKEINKAYQEGDLARLLEIEQQHSSGESVESSSEDDLSRRCKRLEQENETLKIQYENLKRELRLVKNTPEGEMVSDWRKATREKIDVVGQMLEQVETEINIVAKIRDFVRDFRDQKISVKEFLNGPPMPRKSNQKTIEDLFEEMFN